MPEHDDSAQSLPLSAGPAADPEGATPPARRSRARTPQTTPAAEQPSLASRRRPSAVALAAASPTKSADDPLSTNRDALETGSEPPRAGARRASARRQTTGTASPAGEGSANGLGDPATAVSPAAADATLALPAPRARTRRVVAPAAGEPDPLSASAEPTGESNPLTASAELTGEPAEPSPTRGRRAPRAVALTRDDGATSDAPATGERALTADEQGDRPAAPVAKPARLRASRASASAAVANAHPDDAGTRPIESDGGELPEAPSSGAPVVRTAGSRRRTVRPAPQTPDAGQPAAALDAGSWTAELLRGVEPPGDDSATVSPGAMPDPDPGARPAAAYAPQNGEDNYQTRRWPRPEAAPERGAIDGDGSNGQIGPAGDAAASSRYSPNGPGVGSPIDGDAMGRDRVRPRGHGRWRSRRPGGAEAAGEGRYQGAGRDERPAGPPPRPTDAPAPPAQGRFGAEGRGPTPRPSAPGYSPGPRARAGEYPTGRAAPQRRGEADGGDRPAPERGAERRYNQSGPGPNGPGQNGPGRPERRYEPNRPGRPAVEYRDRGGPGADRPWRSGPGARPAGPGPYAQPGNVREPEVEERPRRGPIVDPRRRPGPDEQPVRPNRPGRPGAFTGTVSKLSRDFGFLRDGAGRTRFFHRTAVVGAGFETLREGQTVQFEPQDLPKGLRALNVRVVQGGAGGRPGAGRGEQPAARGAQPGRPTPYARPGPAGGAGRGGTQYGQRRAGGATGGARRSADGGSASTNTGWRSSLSPFRGDPPSAPPRRRPR